METSTQRDGPRAVAASMTPASQRHAPHPERVSDAYADERIREKIDRLPTGREREGLRALSDALRERDLPAATRLHLVTAVTNLGRIARETLPRRRAPEFED